MKGFINGIFNSFRYYNISFKIQVRRQIKMAPNRSHYDLDMVPLRN